MFATPTYFQNRLDAGSRKLARRSGQYPSRSGQYPSRSGQALVEFSIIALVIYLLIGGALTFGLWIYAAGQIQQAANVGARELSQTPLPLDATLEDALNDPVVRQRIYDDRWLVIDLDALEEENPTTTSSPMLSQGCRC